jgi:hypothetical protein
MSARKSPRGHEEDLDHWSHQGVLPEVGAKSVLLYSIYSDNATLRFRVIVLYITPQQ